ncbi:hypothetical protein ACOMHN_021310 [Nucella lapillus]
MGKKPSLLPALATLLVIVTLCGCSSDPQVATCKIPRVDEGQAATLTCDFGVDMQGLLDGEIIINRQKEGSESLEEILDCYWNSKKSGYQCVVAKRFTFTNEISRNASVLLPFASEKDVGMYWCTTQLSDMKSAQPCRFDLEKDENKVTTRESPVKTTSQTSPKPENSSDDEKLRNQVKDIKRRFTVCLVFLLILIIFIIVVIAMFICLPDKVMPIVITVSQLRSRNRASKEAGEIGDKEPRKPLLSDTQEAPKGSDAVPLSTRPKSDPPVHDAGETPGVVTPKTAAEEKPGLQIEGEGEATQGDVEEGQQPLTAPIAEEGDKPAEQSVTVETEGTQEGKKGEDGGKAAQDLATVNV